MRIHVQKIEQRCVLHELNMNLTCVNIRKFTFSTNQDTTHYK